MPPKEAHGVHKPLLVNEDGDGPVHKNAADTASDLEREIVSTVRGGQALRHSKLVKPPQYLNT
jgi:hypothetical protein